MAVQQQKNINIAAPGFAGLNTQDSPVGMDISFASVADHCVIDQFGRVASRKGFQVLTENPEILEGNPVRAVFFFTSRAGEDFLFVCANNHVYLQELVAPYTLSALTLPAAYPGITDDNWDFCTLADKVYLVQAEHKPLKFDPQAVDPTILEDWAEEPVIGSYPNVNLAAFGHQFCASFDGDKSILEWSDLLIGDSFASATAGGSIDLTEVWPLGYDEVVGLYAHNNFLVVFGKESILVFGVPAEGPVYASLSDTITGLGLVARDTVVGTGNDVLFLDQTGVRSLGRTIQEKSVPIGDISVNVRTDIQRTITSSVPENIKAVYHPHEAFYAVFFPDVNTSYVFDTRQVLDNGALRPTRWPGITIQCSSRSSEQKQYFAGKNGVYEYTGSDDIGYDDAYETSQAPIYMSYWTHPQTFDQPANLKFPKQLDLTIIGSTDLHLEVLWSFDYQLDTNSDTFGRLGGVASQYNIDEYMVGEYSGASTLLSTEQFNLWGNGRNVKFGFEATVTGTQLSYQELNIQALTGRII